MIKTPEAKRKRRFKTESGYKLRGAMTWVVLGIVCGLVGVLAATGLALAWTKYLNASWEQTLNVCPDRPVWVYVFDAFRALVLFAAIGVLLFFARRSVARNAAEKYGEFANDIGDWFGFGALIAYGAFGVPLLLVAIFTNLC